MTSTAISIPSSAALRSLAGFGLLALTAMLFLAVVQVDASAVTRVDQLQTYGLALLLIAMVVVDLAWFSAVLRAQAKEDPRGQTF